MQLSDDVNVVVIEPSAVLLTPVAHLLEYPKLIELAGRTCYKSEDRITHDSARRFILGIIKRGHESVIEHCSVTYRIICSRACSHQLVRHRIAAYSQESQRYCDYKNEFQIIVPPSVKQDINLYYNFVDSAQRAYMDYRKLREAGVKPEDARFLLPNCAKTEVVVTYNLRQWRHVINQRIDPHAQWEIRKIMKSILYELDHYIPVFFEDIVKRLNEDRKDGL